MANIMSQVKLRNKPSRDGFDLSKRNLFSAKIGELLPVYCREVIPGDKFDINIKAFTRTMPVNTAAFTRIREYYDWFFVPSNLLWNKFNTFVTQMTENNQHAYTATTNNVLTSEHPNFTLKNLYNALIGYNHQSQSMRENAFGYDRQKLTCKLLDYLNYSDLTDYVTPEAEETSFEDKFGENPKLNPFPLLAYQKIYSDYFRNSQWEKSYAPAFNVDYISGNSDLSIPISSIAGQSMDGEYTMLDLRYANWNKDLFMGVLPNSQFGDAASVDLSSLVNPVQTSLFSIDNNAANGQSNLTLDVAANGVTTFTGTHTANQWKFNGTTVAKIADAIGLNSSSLSSAFTILALRQAESLQRWKEITQSQQQDYKSQIEAHFGVSVSDAYSDRCRWIDGFHDTIDITEVVNSNLADNNDASIAGKGVGVNQGHTKFSSDVHGYLMCIYHAVPLMDYSLKTRIPRQNLKTQVTDYAIPELDQTGMVQVPIIEMTNSVYLNLSSNIDQFLGYAPRYYDYKTDIDEVHGSLRNKNSAWVAALDEDYLINMTFSQDTSLFNMNYHFFKINPAILDPIFVQQLDGVDTNIVDSSVESDQLITNCFLDVKAVRNLDRNGLPY